MTCPRAGPWGPHGALAPLAPRPARYTSDRPTDGRPEPAAPGKPRRVVGWRRDRVPPAPPSHERIDHPAWPGFGRGRAAEPVTASPHRPWTLGGVCRRKSAAPRTGPRGPGPGPRPAFRVRAFPDCGLWPSSELWVPAPLPRRPARRLRRFRVRALGPGPGMVPPTLMPQRCNQLSVWRSPAGCHGGRTGCGSCRRASESHGFIPHCRTQPEGCPTQGLARSARR